MDGYDTGRFIYLALLGTAIAGYYIAAHRHELGKMARQAMLWALIFIGVVAAVGLWSDIRDDVVPQQSVLTSGAISVPRGPDGHYHLTLELDGTPVEFIVDTGAGDVVLTREDAARVGIDLDDLAYTGMALTANGPVRTARTRIDEIRLGEIRDTSVPVYVNEGEMPGSLLGMTYLDRFDRVSIEGGRLLLER